MLHRSGTKCRAANPSSLNFSTKTPVKKGSHNALNVWKSDVSGVFFETTSTKISTCNEFYVAFCVISLQGCDIDPIELACFQFT